MNNMSFENTQAYWLNLFWAREYGDGCFYYYFLPFFFCLPRWCINFLWWGSYPSTCVLLSFSPPCLAE